MILKEDQLWAKKGFEVAYGQEIKVEKENQTHSEYDFKVVEGDGNIVFSSMILKFFLLKIKD